MTQHARLLVTGPFPVGDLLAQITLSDGQTVTRLLSGGLFEGELPAPAQSLRLLSDDPPASSAPSAPSAPQGLRVAVSALFSDTGIPVPPDGTLTVQVVFGAPCHAPPPLVDPEKRTRFGTWEHMDTAALVGEGPGGTRLSIGGRTAPFNAETLLPVGSHRLAFGAIIALAGDFYAHLDDVAAQQFSWAWPEGTGAAGWLAGDYRAETLAGDRSGAPAAIIQKALRERDAVHSAAGEFLDLLRDAVGSDYPVQRYLALASQNHCHFGSYPSDGSLGDEGNLALRLYRVYHARAMEQAGADRSEDGLFAALVVDAFGCHFLTDLFASGHLRVPRRALAARHGVLRGALKMAHAMHEEDNSRGLLCAARGSLGSPGRTVWRAFGDGHLVTPEAQIHRAQVQEAVRRSAAEVFAASCDAPVDEDARAEALLPVPLLPGEHPRPADSLPGSATAPPDGANHYPLYVALADGRIATRRGAPASGEYDLDGLRVPFTVLR